MNKSWLITLIITIAVLCAACTGYEEYVQQVKSKLEGVKNVAETEPKGYSDVLEIEATYEIYKKPKGYMISIVFKNIGSDAKDFYVTTVGAVDEEGNQRILWKSSRFGGDMFSLFPGAKARLNFSVAELPPKGALYVYLYRVIPKGVGWSYSQFETEEDTVKIPFDPTRVKAV